MVKRCIYCLEEKNEALFDTEHVVPQSMGVFENNLVLKSVCISCNNYFGRFLDRILGRDSFEALLRFKYGLKPLSKLSELKGKRLVFRVPPERGAWAGAYIELYEHNGDMVAKPLTQIGFKTKSTGQYEFLLYQELCTLAFAERADLDTKNFKMLASTDEELEKLKDILNKAGWRAEIHGELPPPTHDVKWIDIEITYLMDRMMKRAIAKVAFNYFAAMMQSKEFESILWSDQIELIRSYIRHDGDLTFDPVEVTSNPILSLDRKNFRQTNAHLMIIDWLRFNNGRKDLQASVSLFNHLTYHVTLIRNFSTRPLPEIICGHQFDFSVSPAQCMPLIARC